MLCVPATVQTLGYPISLGSVVWGSRSVDREVIIMCGGLFSQCQSCQCRASVVPVFVAAHEQSGSLACCLIPVRYGTSLVSGELVRSSNKVAALPTKRRHVAEPQLISEHSRTSTSLPPRPSPPRVCKCNDYSIK